MKQWTIPNRTASFPLLWSPSYIHLLRWNLGWICFKRRESKCGEPVTLVISVYVHCTLGCVKSTITEPMLPQFCKYDLLNDNISVIWASYKPHVTKTHPNWTTYSRKLGNYNGTIIFEIDIMKNSSQLNLKFIFFATIKTKMNTFSLLDSQLSSK